MNTTEISDVGAKATTWSWQLIVRMATILPLILIAVFGNLMVIFTKVRRRSGSNSDVMAFTLAICDIFKAICFSLIYLSPKVNGYWILGLWPCQLMQKLLFALISTASTFVVLLTYERFRMIVRPLHGGLTPWKFRVIMLSIVIIHIALFANNKLFLFNVTGKPKEERCLNIDIHDRPDGLFQFEIALLSIHLLSSSVATTYFFMRSMRTLMQNRFANSKVSDQGMKQNKAAIKIMKSVYIAYVTSFVPWVAMYMVTALNSSKMAAFEDFIGSIPLYWIVAGSFCNAPLTYAVFSSEFRKDARFLFSCKRTFSRNQSVMSNSTFRSNASNSQTNNSGPQSNVHELEKCSYPKRNLLTSPTNNRPSSIDL